MEKIKVFGTIIAIFLILIVGKGSDGQESKPPPSKPINIVVILDTSDRVSKEKNPDQLEKDIVIAEGIVDFFEKELVLPELYIGYPHRLAFVVPEQIGTDPIPLAITKDTGGGAPKFSQKKKELLKEIRDLYSSVEQQGKFTGSDIWDWFRRSAEAYLQQDAFNYIICISDGYLDFNKSIQRIRPKRGNKTSYIPYPQVVKFRDDPNREQIFDSEGHGLLGIEKDFSTYDVKFLMVEIKLRHMLDLPILEKYWRTWLESMGIKDSEFVEWQPDPQIVKEKITAFVSQNQ